MSFPRLFPYVLIASALGAQSPDAAWKAALRDHRVRQDEEFRAGKTSPLAGIQRFSIPSGEEAHWGLTPHGLQRIDVQAMGVEATTRQRNGQWWWCAPSGERPVASGDVFPVGRFHVQTQVGADSLTLLVFDPDRAALKSFKGLKYFPARKAYAVPATLEPVEETEPITLTTTRNLKKTFHPHAQVRFRLKGRSLTLRAYRAANDSLLFIPFTDTTTGQETYSVGRFLEIPMPPGRTFLLDFNRAFNPLCNYAPIYNCPIPPETNALPMAIRAGEKTYPLH